MSTLASIALNKNWDIATKQTDSGLTTIQRACDHRAVYQLVRTGLIASKQARSIENPLWINWSVYSFVNSPFQLLAIQIAALINSFEHVESVDFNNAQYSIVDQTLEITGLCFVSDCSTSKLVCEVNV